MAKNDKDPILKFLIDIGVDPKKFTKEVRAALQEAAKLIRSQNNDVTAASKEAFTRAGKEAAKAFYAGFNSIKPTYKTGTPTDSRQTAARPARTTRTTRPAPTELPPPSAAPPVQAPARSLSQQDAAYLASVNRRVDAELRAIEKLTEAQAQAAQKRAEADATAAKKLLQQEIALVNKRLALAKQLEAAQDVAKKKFLAQVQQRVQADQAGLERQIAARNVAVQREIAADARLIAAIDANRTAMERRQQQILAREIAARQRAAKEAERIERRQNQQLRQGIRERQAAQRQIARTSTTGGGAAPPVTPRTGSNAEGVAGSVERLNAAFENAGKWTAGVLGLVASLGTLLAMYKRVTDAAIDFSKSQFLLQVNVRANQRLYGEQAGTIAEWTAEVERLRAKYNVFSRQDLTAAVSQVQVLTRQYGFTREQLTLLLERSAQLSELYGTDLSDALSQATSFLQGNSRALEQYNVDASESSFKTQAVRDNILALGAGWDTLSDGEKALARFNFLMQQTESASNDATRAQETFFGQIQGFNARISEAETQIGTLTAGLQLWAKNVQLAGTQTVGIIVYGVSQALTWLRALVETTAEMIRNVFAREIAALATYVDVAGRAWGNFITNIQAMSPNEAVARFYEDLLNGVDQAKVAYEEAAQSSENFLDTFHRNWQTLKDDLKLFNVELGDTTKSMEAINAAVENQEARLKDFAMDAVGEVADALDDYNRQRSENAKEFIEDYRELIAENMQEEADLARDHGERLEEIERETAKAREEAVRDYWDQIGEIERDGQKEREELARDYADDLADLERDLINDRAEAARDLADKLADINRDEATKLADIDRDRQRERERDEEDHQRELQRIRDKYAIQIDEAVQRRDARAILNLQRQRAQEIKEAQEDFGTRRRREDEDAEERKRQERENAEERRRQAQEDYDRRLDDLARSEEEKRRELAEGYARDLDDLKRSQEEQRQEALRDYQRKLEDLQRSQADKQAAAARDYAQQLTELRRNNAQQELELRNSYIKRQADLEAALRLQFLRMGQHWADSGKLNQQGAKYVTDVLNYYFGLGGLADVLMQGFIQRMRGRVEIEVRTSGFQAGQQQAGSASQPPGVPNIPGTPYGGNHLGMAHGGVVLANGPTSVLMGEAGRELALFLPLAQAGVAAAGASAKQQRIDIDLHLNVDGRTDFFSAEFEDRVTDVIADALREAQQ